VFAKKKSNNQTNGSPEEKQYELKKFGATLFFCLFNYSGIVVFAINDMSTEKSYLPNRSKRARKVQRLKVHQF